MLTNFASLFFRPLLQHRLLSTFAVIYVSMKLHNHKQCMTRVTEQHIKDKDYFNAHSFHQNTSLQVKNINVYQQQQQHYSISSYITRRTGLLHLRPSRTSINSSVVSQCMRSTQYYYRHLLSISGEFQIYFQIKYSSSSSSIDVNSESYFLPYS